MVPKAETKISCKVLTVDPSGKMDQLMEQLVSFDHWHLMHADSMTDAMRIAEKNQPDVVVVSTQTNDLDLRELRESLIKSAALRPPHLILAIHKDTKAWMKRGFREKYDDLVAAPFYAEDFLARLRNAVVSRRMRLKLAQLSGTPVAMSAPFAMSETTALRLGAAPQPDDIQKAEREVSVMCVSFAENGTSSQSIDRSSRDAIDEAVKKSQGYIFVRSERQLIALFGTETTPEQKSNDHRMQALTAAFHVQIAALEQGGGQVATSIHTGPLTIWRAKSGVDALLAHGETLDLCMAMLGAAGSGAILASSSTYMPADGQVYVHDVQSIKVEKDMEPFTMANVSAVVKKAA